MSVSVTYPAARIDRDRFVLARRGSRPVHDPFRYQGLFVEEERAADGRRVHVATLFLTGRECPWRCLMCDLWQHTLTTDTPAGALVRQMDDALRALGTEAPWPQHLKLYNASNFFDPRAVPECDYDALAERLVSFEHVTVECHPALIGRRVPRFIDAMTRAAGDRRVPALEVAMGLETSHPDALERLNKGFTPAQFAEAAERLHTYGATLRVFLLVGVPFIAQSDQLEWLTRSVTFAFECGASVVSLIPIRPGNGALDAAMTSMPTLRNLELSLELALPAAAGRVFADLWDLHRCTSCAACFAARRNRLQMMNLEQRILPPVACTGCAARTERIA
jgi:radical SAM enzyme (TIGR01210 family)